MQKFKPPRQTSTKLAWTGQMALFLEWQVWYVKMLQQSQVSHIRTLSSENILKFRFHAQGWNCAKSPAY